MLRMDTRLLGTGQRDSKRPVAPVPEGRQKAPECAQQPRHKDEQKGDVSVDPMRQSNVLPQGCARVRLPGLCAESRQLTAHTRCVWLDCTFN